MKKIFIFCVVFGFLLGRGICWDDIDSLISLMMREKEFESPFSGIGLSPNCQRDFEAYVAGIKEKKHWALSMFDSMEKFPSGLLMGRRMALGQFDECVSVVRPNFTGQHCMVEIAIRKGSLNHTLRERISPAERIFTGQFAYGVCIPSTCNTTDLKNAFEAFGLNKILTAGVSESKCIAESFPKFRTKDYVVIGLFSFILFLTIGSTAYDVHQTVIKKTEIQKKILTSFSLYSNVKLLFRISDSFAELKCIYGMRFLSLAWVILGNLYIHEYTDGSDVNILSKISAVESKVVIPFTNAFPCVDTFFFLSGLLVCFTFFRDISSKGSHDAPVALIHRYLRLTPSLIVVLLFNFTILSRITVAPYSKLVFRSTETICREYWWSYVLYVQNFFYQEAKRCFPPGWYLCADMQMFLLSPLVMYVLFLWPKFAPKYLCLLILASSLSSFGMFYTYNIPPNRSWEFFNVKTINEYVWFHTRITPWLVGIATGYALCGIRAKKITFRPKKIWIVVGWIIAALLCLSSLFGIAAFYPFETAMKHSALEKSSYRAFHRLGWALGLSWIVIACVNDYGGAVNKFLAYNFFQPLARLSYCAFLIHYSLQLYRMVNDYKTTKYYSSLQMTYTYTGDLIGSIILAIPFTLLIEMPFGHVENILLKKLVILPYPKTKNEKEMTKKIIIK